MVLERVIINPIKNFIGLLTQSRASSKDWNLTADQRFDTDQIRIFFSLSFNLKKEKVSFFILFTNSDYD